MRRRAPLSPPWPPGKHLLQASLLAASLLQGCALLPDRGEGARETLQTLFPASAGTLRGDADVTLSYGRRKVSLGGALLLDGSGSFRLDLLDPLDRPAAIVFSRGERIVQYLPSARSAAALEPLPDACRTVRTGGWVPFVLGGGPPRAGSGNFEVLRWFGGDSIVKYEWGTMTMKIEYRVAGDGNVPSRVSWFCGDETAMRLSYGEGEEGRIPRRFRVVYPQAGLAIDFSLGEHETGLPLPDELFRPSLPEGTRWQKWDLVRDGGRQ